MSILILYISNYILDLSTHTKYLILLKLKKLDKKSISVYDISIIDISSMDILER